MLEEEKKKFNIFVKVSEGRFYLKVGYGDRGDRIL